jgi:hypothetical protein
LIAALEERKELMQCEEENSLMEVILHFLKRTKDEKEKVDHVSMWLFTRAQRSTGVRKDKR